MNRKQRRKAVKGKVQGATADQMPGAKPPVSPERATGVIHMLPPARGPINVVERQVLESKGLDAGLYDVLELDVVLQGGGMAPDGTLVLQAQLVIPPKVTTMPTLHLGGDFGQLLVNRLGLAMNGRVRLAVLKSGLNDPDAPTGEEAPAPSLDLDLDGRPAVKLD